MRRVVPALITLLMVVAVAAFGVFLWQIALTSITIEPRRGETPVQMSISLLLGLTFLFGAAMGLIATVLTLSTWRYGWRDTIERLSQHNRKLAAANRALEAALPVLRESYDTTLGTLPVGPAARMAVVEAERDEAVSVSIDDLAREDALARHAGRTTE
ncbi:MAG: hypothetical protein HYU66_21925 [Armatimonadetes bacterium]|nr:hypothetical protein [Armatimonadota bacterium]